MYKLAQEVFAYQDPVMCMQQHATRILATPRYRVLHLRFDKPNQLYVMVNIPSACGYLSK